MAGFFASSGRIRIENTSDEIVFDTDEGLFVVTDRVTGTIALTSQTGSYNGSTANNNERDVETDHSIDSSINAAADTVRGVFEVSVSGASGVDGFLANKGAFNAGGSYLHYFGGNAPPANAGDAAWENYYGAVMAVYTFIAAGGSLILNERVFVQAQPTFAPATTTTRIRAPTFDYDLFVGTFV